MAKKKKIMASQPEADDKWQAQDDADKIRRYAELKSDGKRYSKALEHMANEHRQMASILANESSIGSGSDEGRLQPRSKARAGRKKTARVPGRK